jgi:hypothetical protein
VSLTGADCFLRAFDAECTSHAGASHLSQLVLRLGPGFDGERFRATLDAAARANPILRAPVVRRLLAPVPVYRTTRPGAELPPFETHTAHAAGAAGWSSFGRCEVYSPPALFSRRLDEPMPLARGRLLRVDAVARENGGTDLAFTWAHLLFDGLGSERFVAWLAACGEGKRRVDDLSAGEGAGLKAEANGGGWLRGLRERGERARAWQAHLATLAAPAPRSLAGPLSRTRQAVRYEVLLLRPDATARFLARVREKAGPLTPVLFPLAAAIRAHAAVFRARGSSPGSFVVPVVANARPKGADGVARAIFRTHVSMLWLRALAGEAEDLDGLVRVLKERRLAFVRAGLLEAGLAALDFARVAPKRLYARGVRRTFGGELASFFFAYTGELLPDTERFFGAPVEGGAHVPGLPPSPGSALVFCLRDGRLGVTHAWQEGAIDAAERGLLRASLLADLVGEPDAGAA